MSFLEPVLMRHKVRALCMSPHPLFAYVLTHVGLSHARVVSSCASLYILLWLVPTHVLVHVLVVVCPQWELLTHVLAHVQGPQITYLPRSPTSCEAGVCLLNTHSVSPVVLALCGALRLM